MINLNCSLLYRPGVKVIDLVIFRDYDKPKPDNFPMFYLVLLYLQVISPHLCDLSNTQVISRTQSINVSTNHTDNLQL